MARTIQDLWKGPERLNWVCVLMEMLDLQTLAYAPSILSGMHSVAGAPIFRKLAQAIFNLRQISLAYVTEGSIRNAVNEYIEHNFRLDKTGIFRIKDDHSFSRADSYEHPEISVARRLLMEPLPYRLHKKVYAEVSGELVVQFGTDRYARQIPVRLPTLGNLNAARHNLQRQPRGSIKLTMDELRVEAELMDQIDDASAGPAGRRAGNWVSRLRQIALLEPYAGNGLREGNTITLEGLRHLIGLPGSGKTTLLMLLARWLGRQRIKTILLFPSIEVCRQYFADLLFYGTGVGLLVGQNPLTRRRHMDRLAESIAAQGGPGGFAQTAPGADLFAASCVLSAFTGDGSVTGWPFGEAPCNAILQRDDQAAGRLTEKLCPLWSVCGRNKAPRDLISSDIWLGHVRSLDTKVPWQAVEEEIAYFELVAKTFDLVIFDEADSVQRSLDEYGAAVLNISGAQDSVHRVIHDQIHARFAQGDNFKLTESRVILYSRDLSEFGNQNYYLIHTLQNISESVAKRYEGQLLTVSRIIGELLNDLESSNSTTLPPNESEKHASRRKMALDEFWSNAAKHAFYDRTGRESRSWSPLACSGALNVPEEQLGQLYQELITLFREHLSEVFVSKRQSILDRIIDLFLSIAFRGTEAPSFARDSINLLIHVTFMILGYQKIVPGTRTMVAEGLLRDPSIEGTVSSELKRFVPENIMGSLSGVKYVFEQARTTRSDARNVRLQYIAFNSAPRMLMHHMHELLKTDEIYQGPAILLASATSFLNASPAYHIDVDPHYILKNKKPPVKGAESQYYFSWLPDPARPGKPLRYSGAREMASRNLEVMVDQLVRGGTEKSEVYKAIRRFDVESNIHRKAGFVVNSYAQAEEIKKYLDDYHPEISKRAVAIVKELPIGERRGFATPAQVEALGDDPMCDIIIFALGAIGRGTNIVFTQGPRTRHAALGTLYFLTRPHPSADDMLLLNSLAGRESQKFDTLSFSETTTASEIHAAWRDARRRMFAMVSGLLREPLMASRLGESLLKPFTANMMVDIMQTIGRGMRDGRPVQVFFVDAAWAPRSVHDKSDTPNTSMLVQMTAILEECVSHPDPVHRAIYQELYASFLEPLARTDGVVFPKPSHQGNELTFDADADTSLMEM